MRFVFIYINYASPSVHRCSVAKLAGLTEAGIESRCHGKRMSFVIVGYVPPTANRVADNESCL